MVVSQKTVSVGATSKMVRLSLVGPFSLSHVGGSEINIGRKRAKGLLAMLALSASGARDRRWLQDKLWSNRDLARGADSLRQELSYLRKIQAAEFVEFLETDADVVRLINSRVSIEVASIKFGSSQHELLEGLDIGDPEFEDWLRDQREAHFENRLVLGVMQGDLASSTTLTGIARPRVSVEDFDIIGQTSQLEDFSRGLKAELMTSLASIGSDFDVCEGPIENSGQNDFVLSGSIRFLSELRATAQLKALPNNNSIWTARYSEDASNTLACQERIAQNVVDGIQEYLIDGDMVAIWRDHQTPLQAWDLYQSGRRLEAKHTRTGHSRARKLYEKALAVDPNFIPAKIVSTFIKVDELRLGWAPNFEGYLSQVVTEYEQLRDEHPCELYVHILGSYVDCLSGHHELALDRLSDVLRYVPDSPELKSYHALVYEANDRVEEAIKLYEDALELTPYPPNWIRTNLALAHLVGNTERTEELLDLALAHDPRSVRATIGKTAWLVREGNREGARAWGLSLKALQPDFAAGTWRSEAFYRNPKPIRKVADELRQAGL